MTLDKLDYVLAVAEERNLRRAAARLYISQPALTAYLNKLEQHLGTKIFDRNVTPIQITEAGTLYITKMKELQKSEALLRMTLRDMGTERRTFRLGMGMTRGTQWLPALIPTFQKMHPDVSVQIQGGGLKDLEFGVIDGSIDVAFGAMTSAFPDIIYKDLRKEWIYCVIPRSFACAKQFSPNEATIYHPAVISIDQIEQETFLMPSPANGFFQYMERIMSQYGLHPSNSISMTNMDTAYHLAAKGCGILITNAFDFHRAYPQYDAKLAFCTFGSTPEYRLSKMAYKESCANIDLIQDLLQIVHQELLPLINEGLPAF